MSARVSAWEAIAHKRAIRRFTAEPLAPDHLDRILEAGRHAGSSKNRQRWTFIVCRDRAHLRELSEVGPYADHIAGAAVAIALVTPDQTSTSGRSIQFDLGQAAMSIMLAAADLGIGSGHSVVEDQELARRILGFPDDRFCALLIPLGYAADRPLRPIHRPNRRPFDEVVHRERW